MPVIICLWFICCLKMTIMCLSLFCVYIVLFKHLIFWHLASIIYFLCYTSYDTLVYAMELEQIKRLHVAISLILVQDLKM